MRKPKTKIWRLMLDDGKPIHLCAKHLADWRERGGKEKATRTRLVASVCAHCVAGL
jgi:hypothetical protein